MGGGGGGSGKGVRLSEAQSAIIEYLPLTGRRIRPRYLKQPMAIGGWVPDGAHGRLGSDTHLLPISGYVARESGLQWTTSLQVVNHLAIKLTPSLNPWEGGTARGWGVHVLLLRAAGADPLRHGQLMLALCRALLRRLPGMVRSGEGW